MNIYEIADTIIRGEKAIAFPLEIDYNRVTDANGNHVLDIRGWGHLQYLEGEGKAEALQDAIGAWVVKTLNEAYNNRQK